MLFSDHNVVKWHESKQIKQNKSFFNEIKHVELVFACFNMSFFMFLCTLSQTETCKNFCRHEVLMHQLISPWWLWWLPCSRRRQEASPRPPTSPQSLRECRPPDHLRESDGGRWKTHKSYSTALEQHSGLISINPIFIPVLWFSHRP